RSKRDWSSDVCSSDLAIGGEQAAFLIGSIFGSVGGMEPTGLRQRRGALLGIGGSGGNLAIGRVDNQRRRPAAGDFAALAPEFVEIGRASCRERGEVSE